MKFIHANGDRPLDGYTIKRGIGVGGFGEVYYATSDGGKDVALKLVQRRLEIELRGVKQCLNLKHPCLATLFDVRQSASGEYWVVMEYLAGQNLADCLAQHPGGLPRDKLLAWFRAICEGVAYLHDRGIVHRDLKPANVFIEDGAIKIGDYGLTKFVSASGRSGQTESVGTVQYMAPELSQGRYGKEIDLYALGIVLYEMLTGHVPFEGESVGEILMKHLTAQPDLTSLPEPFRAIVGRLLAKDPADRYPTAPALLRDLDARLGVAPAAAPAGPVAVESSPAAARFADAGGSSAPAPARSPAAAEPLAPAAPAKRPAAIAPHRLPEEVAWHFAGNVAGRLLAGGPRFLLAMLAGAGIGLLAGGICVGTGGIWADVAPFLGTGAGLLTAGVLSFVFCRGLAVSPWCWPILTAIFAGAGAGLGFAGLVLGLQSRISEWTNAGLAAGEGLASRFPFRELRWHEDMAFFLAGGVACLVAGLSLYGSYASLRAPLAWRWALVASFVGAGTGLIAGGIGAGLGIRDEMPPLVGVGAGFLALGAVAYVMVYSRFGRWLATRGDWSILGLLALLAICAAFQWAAVAAYEGHHALHRDRYVGGGVRGPEPIAIEWEESRLTSDLHGLSNLVPLPEGDRWLAATHQGDLRVLDLQSQTTSTLPQQGQVVAISAGGKLAARVVGRYVRACDALTGDVAYSTSEHPHDVHAAALDADGSVLATCDAEGVVRVFEKISAPYNRQLFGLQHPAERLQLSPSGARLAAFALNGEIHVWDLRNRTSTVAVKLSKRGSRVEFAQFSPDETRLACGGGGSPVQLWDLAEPETPLEIMGSRCVDGRFSPDGSRFLSVYFDHVSLWDLSTGFCERRYNAGRDRFSCAAFNRTGDKIVTGGSSGTVRVWPVEGEGSSDRP